RRGSRGRPAQLRRQRAPAPLRPLPRGVRGPERRPAMNEAISPELRKALRHLKLSPVLDTLPERLVLARHQSMPHQDFLELLLADEISRRERLAARRPARVAHPDPSMVLEAWDARTPLPSHRH